MSKLRQDHPTAALVRRLLDYNPETGVFRWRYDVRRVPADGIAGNVQPDGYRRIGLNKSAHLAHRLAWLYVYGEWPAGEIDHINHDRDDNRVANLRVVSRSQNMRAARLSPRNRSGFRGVHYAKKDRRWIAQIKIDGKGFHLGSFETAEVASAAYKAAAAQYMISLPRDNAADGPARSMHRPTRCPGGIFEALLMGANPEKMSTDNLSRGLL